MSDFIEFQEMVINELNMIETAKWCHAKWWQDVLSSTNWVIVVETERKP